MVLETPKHIGTQVPCSLQGEARPDPADTSPLTDRKAKTDDVSGKLVFCCHSLSPWLCCLLFGTSSLLSPQSPASFLMLLSFYSSPLILEPDSHFLSLDRWSPLFFQLLSVWSLSKKAGWINPMWQQRRVRVPEVKWLGHPLVVE